MTIYSNIASGGIALDTQICGTLNFVQVPPPSYSIDRIDDGSFILSWTSYQPGPTYSYRVFREGNQISSFTSTSPNGSIHLTVNPSESPFIEVLDNDCQLPSIAFPGSITLNWLTVAGATSYLVQQNVSSVWVTKATIIDDGSGAFVYKSDWLNDETAYQFQVVPLDVNGNSATPMQFTITEIRHPNGYQPAYSYSLGTGKFTLT